MVGDYSQVDILVPTLGHILHLIHNNSDNVSKTLGDKREINLILNTLKLSPHTQSVIPIIQWKNSLAKIQADSSNEWTPTHSVWMSSSSFSIVIIIIIGLFVYMCKKKTLFAKKFNMKKIQDNVESTGTETAMVTNINSEDTVYVTHAELQAFLNTKD